MPRSKSLCRQAKVCIPQSLRRHTNESVYASFWKLVPTSESMYTLEPAPTYKGKCVCFVLKACADKRKYVYPRACADIQRKVCMLRSESLCRQAKVCIPQSLRRHTKESVYASFWKLVPTSESMYTPESAPTYKGKCVCFVLKACADKRKYVYPRACLRRHTKENVYASF